MIKQSFLAETNIHNFSIDLMIFATDEIECINFTFMGNDLWKIDVRGF
jgi:hypothetical protein